VVSSAVDRGPTRHGTKGIFFAAAGPTAKAMSWWMLLPATAVGLFAMAAYRFAQPELPAAGYSLRVRLTAILLAAAAASALDDPAAATFAPVPVPRPVRFLIRVALVCAAWTACWAAVVGVVDSAAGTLPWTSTLEAAGFLCLVLAAAAALGSTAIGPALLTVAVAAVALEEWVGLFQSTGTGFFTAHTRDWLIVVSVSVLVLVVSARDPAARISPRELVARRRRAGRHP
jgi:hypothetical protein